MKIPKSYYLRLQLVLAMIISVGSLISIAIGRDIFPFSNYPMYSKTLVPDPNLLFYTVVGTDSDRRVVWIKPVQYLRPFWGASFREALLVEKDPSRIQSKINAAARWYKTSVAENESETERNQDAIQTLRLYRHLVPWTEVQTLSESGRSFNDLLVQYSELSFESETP